MSVDNNSDIHERLAAAEAALHAVGQQISPIIRHVDIAVLIPCFNEAGSIGDVVTVKDGYARNYLLPNKKALRSNAANLKVFEANRAKIESDPSSPRLLLTVRGLGYKLADDAD